MTELTMPRRAASSSRISLGKASARWPLFPIAPTITSRHHSPNGLPSRSASSWRDWYCSSLTLQDIDRVRFLWFTAFSIPFLFFQMISTNWYRKAAKSKRIRDNQMVLTGTLQHPFWGDVSLPAGAQHRTPERD